MGFLRDYGPQLAGASVALGLAGAFLYANRRRVPIAVDWTRKGMFVERSWFDKIAAPAFEFRRLGIEWLIIETSIQSHKIDKSKWVTRTGDTFAEIEKKINPPDAPYRIELWAWGWPIPEYAAMFAAHVIDVLESPFVAGYVLDIEAKSWSTKMNSQMQMDLAAHSLIGTIRNKSKKKLLLSSHGRADFAPLPWNALRTLDGGLPQCYDASNKYGDGFIGRCIDSYRKMGFSFVSPTLSGTKYTSAARMHEMLSVMPKVSTVNWWTWTSIGQTEEKKEVVRNFSLTGEQIAERIKR